MGGLPQQKSANVDLITVVVPCYNSGTTITQTIDSIKQQTWSAVEIIVVNDGSSDFRTLEILHSLQGVKIIQQSNQGLPMARNNGIRHAEGRYVVPLDADDWIAPEFLEVMREFLQKNTDAAYVYCDVYLEGDASGILKKNFNYFEQLFLNQIPYCIFAEKKLWERTGGYDAKMTQGYEDWEFNVRAGSMGYYGKCINLAMFHYRVSSDGMLLSKSNKIHTRLWSEIQKKHPDEFNWRTLAQIWSTWKRVPSRYPLTLYFAWYFFQLIFSERISMMVYKLARPLARIFKINRVPVDSADGS